MRRTTAMALLLSLTMGCSLLPEGSQPPIHFFDIGFPEANPPLGVEVTVKRFRKNGPFGEQMVFRDSSNTLRIDEFNRWSDSPDELLLRYLTLAFGEETDPAIKAAPLVLTGTLLRFDADLTDQTANVIVEVALTTDDDQVVLKKIIREKVPAESNNASSYAKAMEQAVHNLFLRIRGGIRPH